MLYNFTITKPYEHVLPMWQDILAEQGQEFSLRYSVPADGMLVKVRPEQLDTFPAKTYDDCVRFHAGLNLLTIMNYVLFHEDNLLLLITVMAESSHVGEIAFIVDDNFISAPARVKIKLLKAFDKALKVLPFYRLQAKVKVGFDQAQAFIKAMGFKSEGILRGFGGEGVDYNMYSRIYTKE